MTPDHSTTENRDSARQRAHKSHLSDGHHHGTAAKSPRSSSEKATRRSAAKPERTGRNSAKEQEDGLSEDREQESVEDRDQDSSEDRDRDQETSDDRDQDSPQDQEEESSEDGEHEPEDDGAEDRDEDSPQDREQDSSGGGSKRRTAAWAIAAVRSQFADLSGQSVEQVTGVAKGEDSTWTVGVEVLEIRMVPDTADILAQYDVKVDQEGDIIEYRRVRRYLRGRADD